jgi:hypothetical protein
MFAANVEEVCWPSSKGEPALEMCYQVILFGACNPQSPNLNTDCSFAGNTGPRGAWATPRGFCLALA